MSSEIICSLHTVTPKGKIEELTGETKSNELLQPEKYYDELS